MNNTIFDYMKKNKIKEYKFNNTYFKITKDNNVYVSLNNIEKRNNKYQWLKSKGKSLNIFYNNIEHNIDIVDVYKENNVIFLVLYYETLDRKVEISITQLRQCSVSKIFRMTLKECEWLHPFIVTEDVMDLPARSHSKIEVRCPICNTIKSISCDALYLHGISCVNCKKTKSNGEFVIKLLLENNKESFVLEKTFKELRSRKGSLLRFDFYLPERNLLIEVQGKQHKKGYEYSFNKNGDVGINIENDELKKSFCKNKNINLVEIEYYTPSLPNIFKEVRKKLEFLNIDESLVRHSIETRHHSRWDYRDIKKMYLKGNPTTVIAQKYNTTSTHIVSIVKKMGIHIEGGTAKNKGVQCVNNKLIFNSIADANEWCGLSRGDGAIGQNCKGKSKSAGKHPITKEPLQWIYIKKNTRKSVFF